MIFRLYFTLRPHHVCDLCNGTETNWARINCLQIFSNANMLFFKPFICLFLDAKFTQGL